MTTDGVIGGAVIRSIVSKITETIQHADEVLAMTNRSAANQAMIENATVEVDAAVAALVELRLDLHRQQSSNSSSASSMRLDSSLTVIQANGTMRLQKLRELDASNQQSYNVPTESANGRGRPTAVITEDQLVSLRQLNFKWKKIADMLGVSRNTVYRRRQELNLINEHDPARIPSDEELDTLVAQIKEESPGDIGCSIITGAMRAKGYYVHRTRVYHSLKRMDPVGMEVRRHVHIRRRQYWVPGPGSLMHVDTNHKIGRRYGIVVHGGIDGYSRAIAFLNARNNNRADTMLQCFLSGVAKWNWPSRLRTDRGTENVDIARAMIERRGPNRGSHIPGPSVRNQRIERHWRDVRLNVLQGFMDLFGELESSGDLDIGNGIDLTALHFVFIPRVDALLQTFVEHWNQHPVSSEHAFSPYQMYAEGVLRLYHSQFTAIRDIIDEPEVPDWDAYGIDPHVQDTEDHDSNDREPDVNQVASSLSLPANRLRELVDLVDPLSRVEDGGVGLFLQAKQFLQSAHLQAQ